MSKKLTFQKIHELLKEVQRTGKAQKFTEQAEGKNGKPKVKLYFSCGKYENQKTHKPFFHAGIQMYVGKREQLHLIVEKHVLPDEVIKDWVKQFSLFLDKNNG